MFFDALIDLFYSLKLYLTCLVHLNAPLFAFAFAALSLSDLHKELGMVMQQTIKSVK